MNTKKAKSRRITSIVFVTLALAAIIIFGVFYYQHNKIIYNDNSSANGNTAGNLYNNGLFCEFEDVIYFSNPFDKGRLYQMDLDGENVKNLNKETVSHINAYGNYLYFSKNNQTSSSSTAVFRGTLFSAMRSNLKGRNVVTLCPDYSGVLTMVGDSVYFQRYVNTDKKQTKGSIYSVGIDGENLKEIIKEDINPAGVVGSYIYYTGVEKDHNIYRLNTVSNTSSLIFEGNCYMCIPFGEYIYYLDAENNYALTRIKASSPEQPEIIVNRRVSTYNIDKNFLYFQIDENGKGQLCRMSLNNDSDDFEVIANGNYESINVTSNYIYFYQLNEKTDAYRFSTKGSARVEKLSDVFDLSIYEDK